MAVGVPSGDYQILAKVYATAERYVADYSAVRDIGRSDPDARFMNPADAALIQIPGTGTGSPREAPGECLQLVRGATTISRSPGRLIARSSSVEIRCECPRWVCAVRRRRFAVGARPTRRFAPAGSSRSRYGGDECLKASGSASDGDALQFQSSPQMGTGSV